MADIKKYSKSYAPKVVTKLLGEYPVIDRKLFYKRARAMGMDKIEQATYLQLLKEEQRLSIGRREVIADLLNRRYAGMGNAEYIERLVRNADVYALEWFPIQAMRGVEYFPIKQWEVENLSKTELLAEAKSRANTLGWDKYVDKYRKSYLKGIAGIIGETNPIYKKIANKLNAFTWEQVIAFSLTRSGRIGYVYESAVEESVFGDGDAISGAIRDIMQDIKGVL